MVKSWVVWYWTNYQFNIEKLTFLILNSLYVDYLKVNMFHTERFTCFILKVYMFHIEKFTCWISKGLHVAYWKVYMCHIERLICWKSVRSSAWEDNEQHEPDGYKRSHHRELVEGSGILKVCTFTTTPISLHTTLYLYWIWQYRLKGCPELTLYT